jgi:trans-2,3-dihydro-3-hydroxyanthranilate isomerase
MTKHYAVVQVDAFTTVPMEGNACAVLPDADGLSDERMQAIAREMNLSETAFVTESTQADFRCRYFTPREEVPLAGHPTIATVHALAELGRIPADRDKVRLQLTAGNIDVELQRDGESPNPFIVMTQFAPEFGRRLGRNELAVALRVPENSVRPDLPVQVVSTGTPQLMVPLTSLTSLQNARPDAGRVIELQAKAGFFSLHAFTMETLDPENAAHSRHWGLSETGTFEDPVTGSASGGMISYLLQYAEVEPGIYTLEQGDVMKRPGRVQAETAYDKDGNVAPPKIGGRAITVMRGEITV